METINSYLTLQMEAEPRKHGGWLVCRLVTRASSCMKIKLFWWLRLAVDGPRDVKR